YFGMGIIEIMMWAARLAGAGELGVRKPASEFPDDKPLDSKMKYALLLAAFMFVGSLPWLAKGLAQPKYTSSPDELRQQIVANGMGLATLDDFLSQQDSILLEGTTLYPRFFLRNDGIFSTTPWPVYKVREFARIGFLVLNDSANSLIFPSNKPLAFPHGSDALVLGCKHEDYIEARWIYFSESDEVFQSESLTEPCPP
ncbi:MAG TPA: hypothetical protein VMJ90_09755, partial [Anaerolineales bacterium]|nr:hypothetical protein [Anaerolineales bacterium]